ncbi:MAG: hypothetical protein JWO14_1658 [Solirubrobacterales bacterium]|nr:hypothetical protein [Solirubrobacterales bacterium]
MVLGIDLDDDKPPARITDTLFKLVPSYVDLGLPTCSPSCLDLETTVFASEVRSGDVIAELIGNRADSDNRRRKVGPLKIVELAARSLEDVFLTYLAHFGKPLRVNPPTCLEQDQFAKIGI